MTDVGFSGWMPWQQESRPISALSVAGYKSIASEQSIEVRPLTILAGANSSGKSSIMQPLLLLKQTLESSYDPGPLLLDGDNVKFTSVDQFLSKQAESSALSITVCLGDKMRLTLVLSGIGGKGLRLRRMIYSDGDSEVALSESMSHEDLVHILPQELLDLPSGLVAITGKKPRRRAKPYFSVARDKCFLNVALKQRARSAIPALALRLLPTEQFSSQILRIIHLPGLRGNPQRAYPKTAVGSTFPGVFQDYSASVIAQWQDKDMDRLRRLGEDLKRLGLTWKVMARPIEQTKVQLQVGRLPRATQGGAWDLVDIADVGFGVSQVLPVLVALHAAKAGQLVYLEQPEIHLHPRARLVLAELLADAANRGVRVVAETHSSMLLLGIQSCVASGDISRDKVKLHWFERNGKHGSTTVSSADMDASGSFGEWPEDFGDTELLAEKRYLDSLASEER